MALTRRSALAGFGCAVAGAALARPSIARAATPFTRPPLPFAEDALEPHLSARTVALHANVFHQGYVDRLNLLVEGTAYADMSLEEVIRAAGDAGDLAVYEMAAEHYNHTFYFAQFAGGPSPPGPVLEEAINREFGGLDGFAHELVIASSGVFGTGWVWLSAEGEGLYLEGWPDADSPHAIGRQLLMGIDLWEHAYIFDYDARVEDYVRAVASQLVNWAAIEQRYIDGE
ncbi:Fe-Mn family superoxide dismutase [Acuticoccus sp. MNP-M23]|uniref:superoxide dismutase n=1 Tax=Acuticoccus sp. MNP-M23 TaxID=3072793 RepID=UPI0028169101|nr:Fe-Mn family superoxide dismutase [Acuticoccus sp. MNP-M23]WMS43316.1 Fe-Mn family superoxide dismutase [Acuticoccus sp. MNP-M23]